LIDQN